MRIAWIRGLAKNINKQSNMKNNSFSYLLLGIVAFALTSKIMAQGQINSGEAPTGAITPAGDLDTWMFTANAGDTIRVAIGKLSETGGDLIPRIRVFRPDATLAASAAGSPAARLEFTANQTGTYTILVDDGNINSPDGTGTYQLFLFRARASFVVPSGDDGGSLVNGGDPQGTITVGDLDIWSFTANAGEGIVLSVARLSDTGGAFLPEVRLYGPDGLLAAGNSGTLAGRITYSATQTGTYLVVVDDGNINSPDGTGTYQLHFAHPPGSFVVPAGDEGGALISGGHRNGTIGLGDLDIWTFVAYVGSSFSLNLGELSGTDFFPEIRVYRPDGSFLTNNSGNTSAQVSVTSASQGGTYTVVIEDGNFNSPDGTGTYQLSYTRSFDPPHADFNSDVQPDFALFNPSNRQVKIFLMNDTMLTFASSAPTLPAGWTLVDAEQFGGGANSADFLLYNPTTRGVAVWFMNGSVRL